MLKASAILHQGLRDVFLTGWTKHPAPRTAEWQSVRRRLMALNVASGAQLASAYGLRRGLRKTNEFAPLPSGGVIEFDLVDGDACNVDWRDSHGD